MKNFILILGILLAAIVASSNEGFAQTDNNARCEISSPKNGSRMTRNTREASPCDEWGSFTNFTATDMNGGTHDIQSYLDQGKYVVIEFFCAWCGPCWQYYQGGTLEELYNTYGDGGTGEFVVLMVEGELTNTEAQITGTSTSEDYAGMSQGDFTNGGTNPIPIIDATENLAENVSLYEGYVPSVYLFCPSGYVFDIYSDEQLTSNEIYNFATRTCQTEESLPDIGIVKPDFVRMGETATFSSCVISLTDVTYAWTFEDGTPETSTDANADVVWNTAGMHRISLTVANVNGQVEHTDSVYVIDCSSGISTFPFVEDFENGQGCWTLESANTVNEITIGEYSNGMNGLIFSSYDQANNYNQYFISPELHHASALNLSFKYKKHNDTNNQSTGENFYVKYSTTTSDISSFITLGSMITANSNSWETYTGTLPADAKYFMINYNTDYQYYLLVDDLTIEMAAYWSCDFEGDEIWTFGNGSQGNVQWQIVTPETYPDVLISGTNAYFNPFVFQGDTLNETPGHWAMVELISQLTDLGGPGQVAESPWIEFSGIDLSEAQHPKITFRQMFRQLNGIETIVMVSADGQTWTEHNLNEEVESNQYGQNSITKGVNIYEAAGAENVTIRFLVNSDASVSQMGYGWQIDDIKILEAPACDLTLNAARISMFGYVDYRNLPDDFMAGEDESTRIDYAYQLYDPYAQSPRQQWFTQNGFAAFNIEVLNNGYDTITPKARVKVFNPNGDLIYDKIAEGTFALQSDQSDTLDLARNTGDMENSTVFRFYVDSEDEIAPGRYNVEFEILTDDRDEDNTDNYSTQYFYITDSRYSPSYDQPNGYFWPSNYGTEVGTYFTYYYEPDRDVKVDAYIDAHTTAETQLQAIVYIYNNEEYTQVLSSDIVNITEDMLGSWVNFSFNGAFNVTFDEGQNSVEYLITIKTIEGTLAIGSYNLLTNKGKRTRIKNGDTWYYLGKNAAIRLRERDIYTITVESANPEYGIVSGGGSYDEGSEVVITASPNWGYTFFLWDDDYSGSFNSEYQRTVTVTNDSTFTAAFVRDEGVERENVLIELFSYRDDAQHGPVAAKVLDDMEAANTMNIIVINHQFSPQGNNPYYYAESSSRFTDVLESVLFGEYCEYGASPTVFFDNYIYFQGEYGESSLLDKYTFMYNNVKNVKSPYSLTAELIPDEENDRFFTLNITAERLFNYYDGDQIVVMAALTEDIDYDWGVAGKMNNVVRLMYPNSQGTEVTFGNDNLFSTEFAINVFEDYDITKCKLVVWIENHTQGRVLQSKRFNKLDKETFEITALANNDEYGIVETSTSSYAEGDTAILIAIPYDGYCFLSWDDGNVDNPRAIVVTSDSTIVAEFIAPVYFAIDTVVNNFVTVGDHTFYSTGNYTFTVSSEIGCDTIVDLQLRVLAEPVYDIGPNPTKSLLNINSDGFISAVEFYTTTGQLALRKEVNGYEAEFDVEGLVDGVYILRIYGEESSLPSVYKVVKE